MIKNLHYDKYDGHWSWRNANGESRGLYYTNNEGEGIFYQDDRTGDVRQITGLCQFSACETASGMRRKLNRDWFDETRFDPWWR